MFSKREIFRAGYDEAKKWARFFDNHEKSNEELHQEILDATGIDPEKADPNYVDGIIRGISDYMEKQAA